MIIRTAVRLSTHGQIDLIIRSVGTPVAVEVVYSTVPTGGVKRPMERFTLVYLGLVVLTCSLCWKSRLLVLAAMCAVSIMVFVNPSYSVYICYVMFGPGHFIGDLLMPIASFCGAVIFGGQFAFENGYGWFVRLICVLFWSMGFLAIVAAPGEFFSELFSDSGTTQSISSRSTRSDCGDEIDNLWLC